MRTQEVDTPKISIVISTYNAEEWLKKVLWGFNCQTFKHFEIVIADGGSGPKTKELIEEIQKEVFFKYSWVKKKHKNKLIIFQKIRNLAVFRLSECGSQSRIRHCSLLTIFWN